MTTDPRVLVDYRSGDDAGVFRLDEARALVQTVDFFTPIVDDPEAFGAIAAANALSDVYAMGGRPLTALSIAAFPDRDFPQEWAAAIVRGGARVLTEAGCALLGGHSVRDPEIKYGYAVTGLVDPRHMVTNAGGHEGQVLVLTKALGTGLIATALKAGVASAAALAAATRSMVALNREASQAARRHGVTGGTDVTGFGLLGHAEPLARESGVTAVVNSREVPLIGAEVLDLIAAGCVPGGTKANLAGALESTSFAPEVSDEMRLLLADAQTSGGLLLGVPPARLDEVLALLGGDRAPCARVIGEITAQGGCAVEVR